MLQALGPRPSAPLERVGLDRRKGWVDRKLGPLQAHIEGFDLHARVAIATGGLSQSINAKATMRDRRAA